MGRKFKPGVDKVSEEWVKKEVKAILDDFGVQYFMPSASMYGKAGAHDFICCAVGHYVSIEAKTSSNSKGATDLQIEFAKDVRAAGGVALLINEHHLEWLRNDVMPAIVNDNLIPGWQGNAFDGPIYKGK